MINKLGRLAYHQGVWLYALVGPGGCGKETKAKILYNLFEALGLRAAHVCTSSVIRRHSQMDTKLGEELRKADDIMRSGGMAPDEPVIDAISTELHSLFDEGYRIFLKDGFPRTVGQAKQTLHIRNLHLIEFEMDLETSLQRARLRRTQAISKGQKPREDDSPEVVIKRFQVFQETTKPGIKLVRNHCPKRVTSVQATDPIRCQVVRILKSMHLTREQVRDALSHLDNSEHPATKIITEIEGRVTHRRDHRPELQLAMN